MASAPQDWVASAATITPGFETSGDPFLGISGDFDGMGISCGALQWCVGQGSLQPLVIAVGKPVVLAAMPTLGSAMWQACSGTIRDGLAIVRSWQNGSTLKASAKSELRALMGTAEMRAQQQSRIDALAATAFRWASDWATQRDGTQATKRLFCWFFDMAAQNGNLEGLTPQGVKDFISMNRPDHVDDLICDFLADTGGTSGHIRDAHKNADLWRNPSGNERLEILCMSYLRSKTANPRWRHVVLNRKGTIAFGKGWVNSSLYDFSRQGL
ncbi:MAG: peptidoglycan-binding domain 1 protein [Rhizobiaceae bacterium]|nr:peptidoglycan-binding domain 1 protein [Rhizobiaceae bacterium]